MLLEGSRELQEELHSEKGEHLVVSRGDVTRAEELSVLLGSQADERKARITGGSEEFSEPTIRAEEHG